MLKLKLQYLSHQMQRADSLEKTQNFQSNPEGEEQSRRQNPSRLQTINEVRTLHNMQKETPWKESYDQLRQHIKKQRHYFANEGSSSQGYGFSSSHVWMPDGL